MWNANRRLVAFVGLILATGIPLSALAQNSSAIDELANRTSEQLVKRQPKILLIAPRESCNLDPEICAVFDSAVRSYLQKEVPDIRFLGAADAAQALKR